MRYTFSEYVECELKDAGKKRLGEIRAVRESLLKETYALDQSLKHTHTIRKHLTLHILPNVENYELIALTAQYMGWSKGNRLSDYYPSQGGSLRVPWSPDLNHNHSRAFVAKVVEEISRKMLIDTYILQCEIENYLLSLSKLELRNCCWSAPADMLTRAGLMLYLAYFKEYIYDYEE